MAPTIIMTVLITLAAMALLLGPLALRRRRAINSLTKIVGDLAIGYTDPDHTTPAAPSIPAELTPLAARVNELSASLKMARGQSQLQREHLGTLLTYADELVIATDAQDRIALINPAAAAALGRTFAELAGKSVADIFPQKEIIDLCKAAAASTAPFTADVSLPTRGRVMQCHFTAVAMRTTTDYRGTLLLIRDMTAITQAVQMKTDFAANASHELRTPLASIRAAVETINDAGIDDRDMTRRCVDIIGGHALRLQMMVQDLLDLSGAEDPRADVRHEHVELSHICDTVTGMFSAPTGEKGVTLRAQLADDALAVTGDERLILLVLKNLVDNALKFTPTGGRIDIRSSLKPADFRHAAAAVTDFRKATRAVESWCILEVADTGCGIPPENQQRVFERFYTVNQSRGGAYRGTGLGLAIVKHAVAAMGGVVQLESEVNVGTTVRCLLPAYAANGKELVKE